MSAPDRPVGMARRLLMVMLAVVAVEAVVYGVLGGLAITDGDGFGIGTGVFIVLYGLGQLWAARKVTQGESWARSPLVVTHLIQVVVALQQSGLAALVTVLLMVGGVVVLVCLLAPPVNRALRRDPRG